MDWKKLLSDILLVMTQQELASEVGTSQTNINFLKNGVRENPSYRVGAKLIEIHSKHIDQINGIKKPQSVETTEAFIHQRSSVNEYK